MRILALLTLLLAACKSYRPAHVEAPDFSREAAPTLITEVDVFTGFDDFLVENMDVLIVGGRVRAVVPSGKHELEGRVEIVSGRGMVLLPGFIDMHVLLDPKDPGLHLERMLSEGVTTAVVASHDTNVESLQGSIASGTIPGPRLYRSTRPIRGEAPFEGPVEVQAVQRVTSPIEAARAARRDLERHRSDFVRIDWTTDFSQEEARAVVVEASAYKKPVFAAAARGEDAVAAGDAGVALLLAPPWADGLGREQVHEISIQGVPVVTAQGLCRRPGATCGDVLRENLAALHAAGIPLLTGSGAPDRSLIDEIETLVELGMKPSEALMAATRLPVRLLDPTAKFGVVSQGAYADLLLVEGNPLEDIRALRRVVAVWQAGHRLQVVTSAD